MDGNDKKAIEDLFARLTEVERQGMARDGEAEAFIRDQISVHPGAPYYMAQTIVVQEQALQAAQARIEALEQQQQSAPESGGFLGGLFGGGQRASGRVPSIPRRNATGAVPPQSAALGGRGAGGGGFLAGAAQTAMGVAGGLLLGNMIAGAFAGDEAAAAEEVPADDVPADDFGGDDMGGDFGDMEF
jgi:uncharacterized protein